MKKLLQENAIVFLSLGIFVASFCLPFTYSGLHAAASLQLGQLLSGWIFLLWGYPVWLAYPLHGLALIFYQTRPMRSLGMAIAALAIALSLLYFHGRSPDKLTEEDLRVLKETAAFGWGYYLWLLSMAVIMMGQLKRMAAPSAAITVRIVSVIALLLLMASLCLFLHHRYLRPDSVYWTEIERERTFAQYCKMAHEAVHKKLHDVHGLFFDPYSLIDYGPTSGGHTGVSSAVNTRGGQYLVQDGYLAFLETKNDQSGKPYLRFKSDDAPKEAVDDIRSEYRVEMTELASDDERRLGIAGTRLAIRDTSTREVMASALLFLDKEDRQLCLPDPARGFSTRRFIGHVLHVSGIYAKTAGAN